MPGGLFRHHTFGNGEYQGTQSPSAATPGAAASPSILRPIHVLRTLRLSKSAENFEEHEVQTVTGTPTSSTRLPVELVLVRVRLFTLELAEVRLDVHSALSTYCATKWRRMISMATLQVYRRRYPAGRAGLRACQPGRRWSVACLRLPEKTNRRHPTPFPNTNEVECMSATSLQDLLDSMHNTQPAVVRGWPGL